MSTKSRTFRRRASVVTIAALATSLILVVPVLLQARREGATMGWPTFGSAAVVIFAIAFLLWSCAWTLPVLMAGVTDRLAEARVPNPLVRAAVLLLAPVLLAVAFLYAALGGGVREFLRVQKAASGE